MYSVDLKPRAIKNLRNIPKSEVRRIVEKIKALENNLSGDVKRLTNYSPEYRLRVGNYRVLFELGSVEIHRELMTAAQA